MSDYSHEENRMKIKNEENKNLEDENITKRSIDDKTQSDQQSGFNENNENNEIKMNLDDKLNVEVELENHQRTTKTSNDHNQPISISLPTSHLIKNHPLTLNSQHQTHKYCNPTNSAFNSPSSPPSTPITKIRPTLNQTHSSSLLQSNQKQSQASKITKTTRTTRTTSLHQSNLHHHHQQQLTELQFDPEPLIKSNQIQANHHHHHHHQTQSSSSSSRSSSLSNQPHHHCTVDKSSTKPILSHSSSLESQLSTSPRSSHSLKSPSSPHPLHLHKSSLDLNQLNDPPSSSLTIKQRSLPTLGSPTSSPVNTPSTTPFNPKDQFMTMTASTPTTALTSINNNLNNHHSNHHPDHHHQTQTHQHHSTQSQSQSHLHHHHQNPNHHLPNSSYPSPGSSSGTSRQPCAKCGQTMTGQFVRALGTVYHLDCFRCQDCNKVVASKFFPVDAGLDGKTQYPLCETDYFRRLGLICGKCGGALRGSYITALDMKFHVEHFTCSICPTIFGPQDSYYEHSGKVYCHYHYSTRFAVKCTGCQTAILKQFVEINRNNTDEHWHPECYMINKFWNIKLAVSLASNRKPLPPPHSIDHDAQTPTNNETTSSDPSSSSNSNPNIPDWQHQEAIETAQSLKEKQKVMEEKVYRIWTVLSTFEESSAACISEMLRHVSSGHYLEGVKMAGKFVLHVETLFAAIDDLDYLFRSKNAKEISHVREARMLCKKIVNFFSLLSHTHETGARKMSITQELLSLVTGLAHYLKILIRIALTSALKLEREYGDRTGILQFLSRLDRLARDPDASKATTSTTPTKAQSNHHTHTHSSSNGKPRPYGYKSLTRAVGTLFAQGVATTDLCEACKQTVEEECIRFGTSLRWHHSCLRCSTCHRSPEKSPNHTHPNPNPNQNQIENGSNNTFISLSIQIKSYKLEINQQPNSRPTTSSSSPNKNLQIYCEECATNANRMINSTGLNNGIGTLMDGFELVTRLEQYAFLLCVALNKLYGLLKQRGVLPMPTKDEWQTTVNGDERSLYDAYRNSTDIKRMKSVDLDRKLSTTARLPQRSTVVESPSGRVAQAAMESNPTGGLRPQESSGLRNVGSRSPLVPSSRSPSHHDRSRRDLTNPTSVGLTRERDYTNLPRSEPPPRPQPTHLSMIPQTSSNGTSSGSMMTPTTTIPSPNLNGNATLHNEPQGSSTSPVRPTLSRNLTAVRIVDEQPMNPSTREEETSIVETTTSGITLADLPRAMEAERFRVAHKALPTQVTTLSELSALESVIVKHVAAFLLASNEAIREICTLDELLEMIEVRKGNFWGKLFKGNNEKAKIKKKGVFGVPLDVLIERHGVDSLLGAGAGQLRVPSFVDDVISAMKQMDMSVEGIFRKNGNIRRLKELTDSIDRDDGVMMNNFSDDNPVQLAALLKKFLRDLPDPLLTFKLHHLFIASQRIENEIERRKTLHLICCLLPKAHRDTMEVLFVFMKWVASFSHVDEETGSKMDLQNLATVITPNILYNRSKEPPSRDESFLAIRAVNELLESQDEIFMVPETVWLVMRNSEMANLGNHLNVNEITSKDIMKKVEGLLKSKNVNSNLTPQHQPHQQQYRGKGEVLPHRPDYHSSASFNPPSSSHNPSSHQQAYQAQSQINPNSNPNQHEPFHHLETPIHTPATTNHQLNTSPNVNLRPTETHPPSTNSNPSHSFNHHSHSIESSNRSNENDGIPVEQ